MREVNDSMGYICEAKMKKSTKSQALNTVKDFISNLHELTKDFLFIKDTNLPLLEEQRKQNNVPDVTKIYLLMNGKDI